MDWEHMNLYQILLYIRAGDRGKEREREKEIKREREREREIDR